MSLKKCTNCGTEIPENGKFCPDCGNPIAAKMAPQKTGKTKNTSMRDNIIIIGVIVLVAVAFYIMKSPSQPEQPVQQQNTQDENPHADAGMMGAIPNMPTDYEGLITLGNQTMDQGNYPMAAECYKRALLIKGDDPNVRTDFGACLHSMGLPERAIEEFRVVIAGSPAHAIAHFNMGIVYYGMDQNDSAKVYWKRYLQLDPNGNAVETVKKYMSEIE